MARSMSDKASQVGNKVSTAAKNIGKNIAKGAEAAVDYVRETTGIDTDEGKVFGVDGIEEHMDVIASCGKKIGVVDGMEAGAIKLTRKDSPDDQHHYIPLSWISTVDSQVHLNKNSKETVCNWKSTADACGCDSQCD